MIAAGATISTPICFSSLIPSKTCNSKSCNYFPGKYADPQLFSCKNKSCSLFSTFSPTNIRPHFSVKASSSVGSAEYTEEPATSVKFQKFLCLPGCSSPLSLLGTGYREKVFAIIGVKVYAAGLYVNQSILSKLNTWKGQAAAKIQEDSSLFDTIYNAPLEKSLQIVLVRDVDGKTFWDALDDAISPRIKTPTPVDQSALSTFRSIFQGRSLKKGTFIFLTWPEPSKMLVCISSDGLPSGVDATIESENVTFSLYDVFFGGSPVSPSLKASVTAGLANIL
ncbi:Chalcone-flavonone isomerase family protein [Melia azedarach]|uniref:Chalcone-flavonone isomerase family protein n=1 Tax=Melia azedarach TaxID=155640 RepID=A0ACC1YVA8_MELAZ|nr:Chalcone-flavonone isomerase family protein [Melia azedarach]